MNRQEMLEERKDIVDECVIFKKEVFVKGNKEIIQNGPCTRIDGNKCTAYIDPSVRWKLGPCFLATHIIHEEIKHKFINPLKVSKKSKK